MIKYDKENVMVCFEEIPDRISLGLSISNCAGTCVGCHSPWLRTDMGEELTEAELDRLIERNQGINCVLFLGEGRDKETLLRLAKRVKEKHGLKTALYSGRSEVSDEYDRFFDYIKIGPYIEEFGPLNKRTTNQRLYRIEDGKRVDITERFWRTVL